MVINFWKCFILSNVFTTFNNNQNSSIRDSSRVFCQETSWCIEVGLLVRTSQAWKTFLSPGCIKEDSWQFFSFISFLYPSLYYKNSLPKTHHSQWSLEENFSVLVFILTKKPLLYFSSFKKSPKKFLKNFY